MRFTLTLVPALSFAGVLFGASPLHAQARPQAVRISEMFSQRLILQKVQPAYPRGAREKHIEGSVVLRARISKQGDVVHLEVVKPFNRFCSVPPNAYSWFTRPEVDADELRYPWATRVASGPVVRCGSPLRSCRASGISPRRVPSSRLHCSRQGQTILQRHQRC